MKKILLLLVGFFVTWYANADVTIRFEISSSWSQVNIWAYTNDIGGGTWLKNHIPNSNNSYSWPGPSMTLNSATGLYEITFTEAPEKLIFSNSGSSQVNCDYNSSAWYYNASGVVSKPSDSNLYLVGQNVANSWDGDQTTNWTPTNAYSLTLSDDGYYYFKASAGFKLSTVKADWNVDNGFNSNALQASTWSSVTGDYGTYQRATFSSNADNSTGPESDKTYYFRINEYQKVIECSTDKSVFIPTTTYTYAYGLWNPNNGGSWAAEPTVATSNPYEFTLTLSAPVKDGGMPLCLRRITYVNDTADESSATNFYFDGGEYTPSTEGKTFNINTEAEGNITLAYMLAGSIKCVLNLADDTCETPTSLKLSGGSTAATYDVYFYSASDYSTVNAYTYGGSEENASYPGEAMTKLSGKTVTVNGTTYNNVWKYTVTRLNGTAPSNIIINKGTGDSNKLTTNGSNPEFYDNGFYTDGDKTGDTIPTLSEVYIEDAYYLTVGSTQYQLTRANNYQATVSISGTTSAYVTIGADSAQWGCDDATEYNATDATYTLTSGGANLTTNKYLSGDVTFTFAPDSKQLTISGGSIVFPTYYIIGAFNSWAGDDTREKFETTDGTTYTLTLSQKIAANNAFLVYNGAYSGSTTSEGFDGVSYGNCSGSASETLALTKNPSYGKNITVTEDLPVGTKVTFTLVDNGATATLKFEKRNTNLQLTGTINGEATTTDMTTSDQTNYSLSLGSVKAGDSFQIQTNDAALIWGCNGGGYTVDGVASNGSYKITFETVGNDVKITMQLIDFVSDGFVGVQVWDTEKNVQLIKLTGDPTEPLTGTISGYSVGTKISFKFQIESAYSYFVEPIYTVGDGGSSAVVYDTDMDAVPGGANAFTFQEDQNNVIVTFVRNDDDTANSTVKVTTYEVEDVVLSGSFNSWANNDSKYQMTQSTNDAGERIYTYSYGTMYAGTTFNVKTAEDNQNTVWGAAASTEADYSVTGTIEGYKYTVTCSTSGTDVTVKATFEHEFSGWVAPEIKLDGTSLGKMSGSFADGYTYTFTGRTIREVMAISLYCVWGDGGNATTSTINYTVGSGSTAGIVLGQATSTLKGSGITFKADNRINKAVIEFNRDAQTLTVTGIGTETYTVYYYNTDITVDADDEEVSKVVKAYVWDANNKHYVSYPGEAITRYTDADGKNRYAYVNGKYCPVYQYTFTWERIPTGVIFTVDGTKAPNKDLTYVDGKVYNKSGASDAKLSDFIVFGDQVNPNLYFQVKYDLENNGKNGADTQLYCHIYKSGGDAKYTLGSDQEKMTIASEKYSLWKYEISKADAEDYDACLFCFKNSSDNWVYYRSDSYDGKTSNSTYTNPVSSYEQDNWTKYIYSTAENNNNQYAVQSYLSYEEFMELDQLDVANGGRRNIYLIGWNGIQYSLDKTSYTSFPSSISGDLLKLDADGGAFYLPVKGSTACTSSSSGSSFKVSWLNVGELRSAVETALTAAGKTASTYINDARSWATFDLGLIGVNKDTADEGTYDKTIGTAGTVIMPLNKSVPYMNYNQANWSIGNTGGDFRMLIIDTHAADNSEYACKTATLTNFDPDPSIEITVGGIQVDETLSASNFQNLVNGELYGDRLAKKQATLTRVNYAGGEATIKGTDSDALKEAGYNRTYLIYVNDVLTQKVTNSDGTETIDIQYLPLSKDNTVSVRCLFDDTDTGRNFFSRTGKGTISGEATLEAPTAQSTKIEGKYIYQGEKASNGDYIYGVYIPEGLNVKLSDSYAAYADLHFIDNSGNTYNAELITEDSDIYKFMDATGNAKNVGFCDGFNASTDDWNTYVQGDNQLRLYIHNVCTAASDKGADDLTDIELTCELTAVYPFYVNSNATTSSSNSSSVRRRATADEPSAISDEDDDNAARITYMRATTPVTFTITTANVVSGVESVAVDHSEDAPVEYYNLSGIRVMGNPTPGIYLRRQGNQVTKVVVR